MGEVLDFRGQADHATDGIVNIINAMAKSKQAETDLQKTIMLDQLKRQRDRQDKQNEQTDQNSAWASAMNQDNPQGNPMTNNSGVANGATPSQVAAPTDASNMPQGQPSLPPMTMADPSQQPARDAMSMAQPPQSVVQPQVQMQPIVSPSATPMAVQAQQPEHPASQITDLGFTPIGVGQLGLARKGKPEAKDFAYIGALNKAKQGIASPGELDLIKDFNGFKDKESSAFNGIDTVNLSPTEIGEQLRLKNPSQYNYLEAIKDGKVNIAGRTSKDLLKDIKAVETLWPGTDTTIVRSRMDVRKDYTSGPTSKIVDALNTSLLHGEQAAELIKKVNNRGLLLQNKIGNILKVQTNDPDLLALKDTIEKYNRESAKAIAGSGQVYVDELKNNNDQLDAAQSVDAALNVINNRTKLFSGRTTPLAERWSRSFGEDQPAPVLGPHAQKVLIKNGFQYDPISGDISQGDYHNSGTGPMTENISPDIGTVEGGYKFKGGDPSKPESWEKI